MKIIMNISQNGRKLFLALLLSVVTTFAFAQDPPPPPGGGGTEDTRDGDNQLGGGAPIDGGVFFLIAFGAAYVGRKAYVVKKQANIS